MRNKLGITIVVSIVAITIGYAFIAGNDAGEPQSIATTAPESSRTTDRSTPDDTNNSDQPRTVVASGRYTDFTADRQMEQGFDTTVLFFYASWCPECRAFDDAIQSQAIPEGTQILRVNYDNSQELKQQYGVTIQTTFVSVSSSGELVKKWIGYGQDKTVDAIIQNVSS